LVPGRRVIGREAELAALRDLGDSGGACWSQRAGRLSALGDRCGLELPRARGPAGEPGAHCGAGGV